MRNAYQQSFKTKQIHTLAGTSRFEASSENFGFEGVLYKKKVVRVMYKLIIIKKWRDSEALDKE